MVQIAGKYKLDKNENYVACLKSLGISDEVAQKAETHQLFIEIIVEGNKFTFRNGDKIYLSFTLDKECDEPLPAVAVTLKTFAKLDGNRIILNSKAPDGRSGIRTYDFTDNGCVFTLTTEDVTAKRYYSRI